MNVERVISWFDNKTDKLVGEKSIDNIELEKLKQVIIPSIKDPMMYDSYYIDEEKSNSLRQLIDIDFDFSKFSYYLECYQKQ